MKSVGKLIFISLKTAFLPCERLILNSTCGLYPCQILSVAFLLTPKIILSSPIFYDKKWLDSSVIAHCCGPARTSWSAPVNIEIISKIIFDINEVYLNFAKKFAVNAFPVLCLLD